MGAVTATCPHCGGALGGPAVHRSELERQLGDAGRAADLRDRAQRVNKLTGVPLGDGFYAYMGYVWAKCRIRKPAKCFMTGHEIPAGGMAYRQLSEVKDRDLRIAADWWEKIQP